MRRIAFVAGVLVLTACSRTTTSPHSVFEHAFGSTAPQGVDVVNGYLWENRHLLIFYEETWRLELCGPAAMDFVRARWPDLKPTRPGHVDNRDAPWFASEDPDNYESWTWKQDYAVTVMQSKETRHVFVAFTAL